MSRLNGRSKWITLAVTVVLALIGILHGIQNHRLTRVEDCKAEASACKANQGRIDDIEKEIHGKGGLNEVLIRVDERVAFLFKAQGGEEPNVSGGNPF